MRKLSRKKSNREHMIKNLAASLVLYESITTTKQKAKEVRDFVERLVARNKENSLNTKRRLIAALPDRNAAKKVAEEFIPRYKEKKSGFVRTFGLKNRLGDNAEMIRIEMVDKKVFADEEKVKPTKGEEKNISKTVANKVKKEDKDEKPE